MANAAVIVYLDVGDYLAFKKNEQQLAGTATAGTTGASSAGAGGK